MEKVPTSDPCSLSSRCVLMKSRVDFCLLRLGVYFWPSASVDNSGLLLLFPCGCCECSLPGAVPRSVCFSSIGGSPTPQLELELSSGLSCANPLCTCQGQKRRPYWFLTRLSQEKSTIRLCLSVCLSVCLFNCVCVCVWLCLSRQ
jgi:hypothetical protein